MSKKYIGDITIGEWHRECKKHKYCIPCPFVAYCKEASRDGVTLELIDLTKIGVIECP